MRDYVLLGSRLLIICIVAAALLAGTNLVTRDKIEEQNIANEMKNVNDLFGGAQDIQKIESDAWAQAKDALGYNVGSLYSAKVDGNNVYALQLKTKGYGGDVTFFVGIGDDGKLLGLRVGEHTETAGLGSKITLPEFYGQFTGLTAPLEIRGIDGVSGATYSTIAAVDAVNAAADIVKNTLPQLALQ